MLKGFTRNIEPLRILSETQVEAIHREILEILEEVGVRFESEEALKLHKEAGCNVDFEEKRIKFPPHLVEDCIRRCPSSVHVKSRDEKHDLRVGGNVLYFMMCPGMRKLDIEKWEPVLPTLKDQDEAVRVIDYLPNVHALDYGPYFELLDIPPCMTMPLCFASRLFNTTKIMTGGYSNNSELFNIEMAKIVDQQVISYAFPSPPLTFYEEAYWSAKRYAEAGHVVMIPASSVFGATGPVTLAGAVAADMATMLAGVVMTQLIKPGTPMMTISYVFPMSMSSGAPAFGSVGCALHNVMFTQLSRYYGIPRWLGSAGYASSSKLIDYQNGYERALCGLSLALSGSNCVEMQGGVYAEITHHPIQSILDDDIAGWIGKFIEGVPVNDETMALDLIKEVGPIPGEYLSREHTRKHWKEAQFVPAVADRLTFPDWIKQGKHGCIEHAKDKMKEILATHKPTPLTENQAEQILGVLNEARQYYKKVNLMTEAEDKKVEKVMKENMEYRRKIGLIK